MLSPPTTITLSLSRFRTHSATNKKKLIRTLIKSKYTIVIVLQLHLIFSLSSLCLQSNFVIPRNSNYSTTALLHHLATLPTVFGSDSVLLTDILRTTTSTLSLTSYAPPSTQNNNNPQIIHDRFYIYGYYSGNEPVHRTNYYDQLLS